MNYGKKKGQWLSKMKKRIICTLLAASIVMSMSACGKKDKETAENVLDMKNVTYYQEQDLAKELEKELGFDRLGMRIGLDSKNQLVITDQKDKDFYNVTVDTNGKRVQEYKSDYTDYVFTLDSQNNRYVAREKYGEVKAEDKKREVETSVVVYNSNGERQKSFDLGKRTYTDEQAGITDIAVDSSGNIYLLQRRAKIEVLNSEGKPIKEIEAKMIDFIEIDDKDNLLMGSSSGETGKSSVESISLKQDKGNLLTELDSGHFMHEMNYSLINKKLYLLTEKGIIACTPEGKIEGYVFDLKQSSLLDAGIYINDFVFDKDKNIYILAFKMDHSSGENKSVSLFYKYSPLKEKPSTANQKTLSIYTRYSEKYIESAIAQFQKKHPDIKIDLKDFTAATISSSADGPSDDEVKRAQKAEEDFKKVVTTELMAGQGPDIIEIDGLPYKKYTDKNTLVNLSEMIEKDKAFDINNYKQNILDAFKYKGNLFVMPVNFGFSPFAANKTILDKEGIKIDDTNWTWEEFLKMAQIITRDTNGDGKPDQYALDKTSPEEIFGLLLQGEEGNFIDLDNRTCKFDSKEFIDLLKFAKEFSDKGVSSPKLDIAELYKMLDPGTIGFMRSYFGNYQGVIQTQSLMNSEVVFFNTPSYSDKSASNIFYSGRTYAINNNSKLKDEAWEFIKLLLSDEIQSRDDMYQFPISISALDTKAKTEITRNYIYQAYKEKGRKIRALNEEDVKMVNKMIDELKVMPYSEEQASQIITEGVKDFFSGKKTAEETAKLIQSKVSIYLNE